MHTKSAHRTNNETSSNDNTHVQSTRWTTDVPLRGTTQHESAGASRARERLNLKKRTSRLRNPKLPLPCKHVQYPHVPNRNQRMQIEKKRFNTSEAYSRTAQIQSAELHVELTIRDKDCAYQIRGSHRQRDEQQRQHTCTKHAVENGRAFSGHNATRERGRIAGT